MTDLLVIVVAVLFVLVLLDGLRRKWSARNRVVLKLDRSAQGINLDDEELTRSELPNGGARTKPRADPVPPRPPRPAPKLSVLQPGWQEQRRAAAATQPVAVAAAAGAVQSRDVPVLLDAVEVEEERIEHTNVYADSSAIPVDEVTTRTAVPTPQEETMGIYRDDIDASIQALDATDEHIVGTLDTTLPDLVSDLAADRPLLAGGDDDEDDWEEEWDDEEEDDEEDEASSDEETDEESEDGEYWEEVWEDDEEVDEDEDEEDDEDDYDDEYDEEEDDEEEDDEDDYEDDEDDEEDDDDYDDEEDDEERFPDDEEDELDAWNRRVAAEPHGGMPGSAAVQSPVQAADDRSVDRFEPGFSADGLEAWELGSEPDFGPADDGQFNDLLQPAAVAVAESVHAAAPVAGVVAGAERRSMFAVSLPGRKHQGELFQEEQSATPGDGGERQPAAGADQPREVIVVNVMARPGLQLAGSELLPVLQLQGLRLGDMSIFHKYSGSHGTGSVVFSMANMVKPGTFDLAAMDSFTTPGVSFFLQLPSKHGNMASFEQMLGVANAVRTALDAELKDEHRNVLTRQTLEHYRQRIRDFELSLLTRR